MRILLLALHPIAQWHLLLILNILASVAESCYAWHRNNQAYA
jgi:hypothetical protein